MSKSFNPVDITQSSISGIVTIDNKLYDCSQILQSLSTQGFPIKKYGSSLKIGNQVISPIPSSSNIPISTPGAQNIIQAQFRQLFEEINILKDKVNSKTITETSLENDSFDSIESLFQPQDEIDYTHNNVTEPKDWNNLIQDEEKSSSSKFDVGENNLQRKWTQNQDHNILHDDSHPDVKYRTEYFSLGMHSRNQRTEGIQNISLSRQEFNDSLSSEEGFQGENTFDDRSLEKLTEELVSRIEKNLVCPKCLNTLPSHAYFCSKCGLKVQKKELKIPQIFDPEFKKE